MTNFVFKCIYNSGGAFLVRKFKKTRLTVISLHKISTANNFFWQPISPLLFEQLLQYLKKNYNVVTFSQLQKIEKTEKPLAILSFDDGYLDFVQNALPLIEKYELCCNHNVIINCLESGMVIWTERLNSIFQSLYLNSETNTVLVIEDEQFSFKSFNNWVKFYNAVFIKLSNTPISERVRILTNWQTKYGMVESSGAMMTWKDLKGLSPKIVEIGSHTCAHDILTTIKDPTELRKEIFESKSVLEQELQREINVIAPPNGIGNEEIFDMCKKAGYKYILLVNENDNLSLEPGIINRINVVNEPPFSMFCRIENIHNKIKSIVRYGRVHN